MHGRVVVLGGGHGVAAVLRALREDPLELTVVVTIADNGGSSGALQRHGGGAAVGDMRRSLSALAGEESVLGRALARPLTLRPLGTHPLGNLVIRSLAAAFDGLEPGTAWLGRQLGISAAVLPATTQPVELVADTDAGELRGETAIGSAPVPIRRLRFEPARPSSPEAALSAIARADWVLIAPGSLFTSTLAATAPPQTASAIARTGARVLWISNLVPERFETAGMSAGDHLEALRGHGVRVGAVLYDPAAELSFSPAWLVRAGLPALSCPLRSQRRGLHDPQLLRAALATLVETL